MIIYLAGGITGNLINEWKKVMEIYLAAITSHRKTLSIVVDAFLSGGGMMKLANIKKTFMFS